MCDSRKYPYPPHRSLEISREWWVTNANIFKRKREAKSEIFHRGGGFKTKENYEGMYGYFLEQHIVSCIVGVDCNNSLEKMV